MIEIRNMNKTFRDQAGTVDALNQVSLKIERGEVYGVIGYSGAGKSTLVRCLNFLETPDNGGLTINGQSFEIKDGKVYQDGKRVAEKQLNNLRRGIGMIFQHFNLLERSTVAQNIAYPLKYSGMDKNAIDARVDELLALVDLSDKKQAYPDQLSGGQKQRVAIARALANNPEILLSDEATSALDPEATEAILELLRDLNKKLGITIVLITHEMAVIKAICHKVAVMENGRVVEVGDVYDVFAHPQAEISKKFVSSASALSKITKMLEDDSPLCRITAGQKLVKLMFNRESTGDAIISRISQKFDARVNIVLANVEMIQDAPLGGMIAIISGTQADDALAYLKDHMVDVDVILDGSAK